MAGFPRPRGKRKFKTAGSGKRVIAVFGPPGSGVSTVIECLSQAARTPTVVIPYLGPASIRQAEEAQPHYEVVFLDVDGGVFTPKDVQELVDSRLIYQGSGAVIRLYADDEEILHRTASRPDYITDVNLKEWSLTVPDVEERIRLHDLSYFMLPNNDLEQAVRQLALRAGINR